MSHPDPFKSADAAHAPPPVVRAVTVRLQPADAFDLFTRQMRVWWPFAGHSCGDAAGDVHFEPRAGGEVTEIGRSGERWTWGRLTEWDPPHVFAMTWHPGQAADHATQLRVRFVAVAGGTEVHVHHDGWAALGAAAAARRDNYDNGWPAVLAAFVGASART